MKLLTLTPLLRTQRMEETLRFYTDLLDFQITAKNDDWGWATLARDGIEIMISVPNEHLPFDKAVFTGSFYFKTAKVRGLWAKLKDKATICYPLEDFEWGMTEFAIYDNNGYLLQFGEEQA